MIESLVYYAALALVIIGVYTIVTKENLIKKIIGLVVLTNGTHMFLIALGYRTEGIPPIMGVIDPNIFAQIAVDPIPQALVLTSIVINLSITALGLSIITRIYKQFGTVDTKKLKVLKG